MSKLFKGLPSYQRKQPLKVVDASKPVPVKKEIKNIKRSIRKIHTNIELKYVDVLDSAVAITDAGVLTLLNSLGSGDDQSTRTGDEVTATSIQFRGFFTNDQSHTALSTMAPVIRHLIIWDSQANGANPTIGSTVALPGILDNTVVTDLTLAPYNRNTQKRYKILYDNRVVLNPPGFTTTTTTPFVVPAQRVSFSKKIKLSRIVKYDSIGNGIADINTNSLFSLVVSNVSSDQPTITCGYRFYFKDA